MICIGLASIAIGHIASTKVKKLVKKIGNQHNLGEIFSIHDKDRDGCLSVREFRNLVKDLNVNLSDEELNNTFVAIDGDNDRLITYEDMSTWFTNARYDIKADNLLI